jgi:AraC-like DNA-binding protein
LFYGIAQGTVLAGALLFGRRGRKAANVLLSAMLISSITVVVPWWLGIMGWIEKAPWSMYVTILLGPAIGPLYYFYTRALLYPDYKPKIVFVALAALLPGSLRLVEMLYRWLDTDVVIDQVYRLLEGEAMTADPSNMVGPILDITYRFFFVYLAWRLIRRTAKRLVNEYAEGVRRYFTLLNVLTVGLCVIMANAVATWIIMLTTREYTIAIELTLSLIRCLFIQSVAIAGFFLPEGFTTKLTDLAIRHRRAPMDQDAGDRYLAQLMEYMKTNKPYTNEGLRLADLAEQLSVQPHVLSQVINERLQVNFFDFINKYRVEEAMMVLKDAGSDQYTLLGVARDAGFKCKASFNRAFKKHAGMSPSQYRRGHRTRSRCNTGEVRSK